MFSNNKQSNSNPNKCLSPSQFKNYQLDSAPVLLNSQLSKHQFQHSDEGYISSFATSATNSLNKFSEKIFTPEKSRSANMAIHNYQNIDKFITNHSKVNGTPTFGLSTSKQFVEIANAGNAELTSSYETPYDSDFCYNINCHCRNRENIYFHSNEDTIKKKNETSFFSSSKENKLDQLTIDKNLFSTKQSNGLIQDDCNNSSLISFTQLYDKKTLELSKSSVKYSNSNEVNFNQNKNSRNMLECTNCTNLLTHLDNKQKELIQLRSSMEKNETAMILVNESKIQNLELNWKSKMEDEVKKNLNNEQNLLQQVFDLQSKNEILKTDLQASNDKLNILKSDSNKMMNLINEANEQKDKYLNDFLNLKNEIEMKNLEKSAKGLQTINAHWLDKENSEHSFNSEENVISPNSISHLSNPTEEIDILTSRLNEKCAQLLTTEKKYQLMMHCLITKKKKVPTATLR